MSVRCGSCDSITTHPKMKVMKTKEVEHFKNKLDKMGKPMINGATGEPIKVFSGRGTQIVEEKLVCENC